MDLPQWDDVTPQIFDDHIAALSRFIGLSLEETSGVELLKVLQRDVANALLALIKAVGTVEVTYLSVDPDFISLVSKLAESGDTVLANEIIDAWERENKLCTGLIRYQYADDQELIVICETGRSIVIVDRSSDPIQMNFMARICFEQTDQISYIITHGEADYQYTRLDTIVTVEEVRRVVQSLQIRIKTLLDFTLKLYA